MSRQCLAQLLAGFILLLTSLTSAAQFYQINGQILDANKTPLAWVLAQVNEKQTQSDTKGHGA